MKKAAPAMYRPGDETLFCLFDTGEMEHVCDLVRVSHARPPRDEVYFAQTLRKLLLTPVNLFIGRLHETGRGNRAVEYKAADAFRAAIDDAAASCEGAQMDARIADLVANRLESAWTKFIAYAAAHMVYDQLPRDLEKWQKRIDDSRTGGDNRKKGADVEHKDLDDLIDACLVRGENPNQYIRNWAETDGCSESTVRRRIGKKINPT